LNVSKAICSKNVTMAARVGQAAEESRFLRQLRHLPPSAQPLLELVRINRLEVVKAIDRSQELIAKTGNRIRNTKSIVCATSGHRTRDFDAADSQGVDSMSRGNFGRRLVQANRAGVQFLLTELDLAFGFLEFAAAASRSTRR
jgi:hypothetical protein